MSDVVTIVLDGSTISDAPGGFFGQSDSSFFNFTTLEPNGTLSLSFQGTSIAFIGGVREQGNRTQSTFGLSIHQSSSFIIEYDPEYPQSITPQTIFQWYTSPSLPDSPEAYSLELSSLQLVGIDYVLIEAGGNTPLTGQTILVDDINPEIIWNGHWTNQSDFTTTDGFVQRPNGNGTHSSSTVGDSFEFQFAGTSIIVAGVISLSNGDSFTASFALDNSNPTVISFQISSVLDPHEFNFIYFNDSSLSAGNHTLTVNLTQVAGNAAFVVDYLMYEPTFDFLSGKPNFTQPSATNGSGPSSAGPSPTGSRGDSSHQSHVHIGVIVGGVIGGVAALCFIALGVFLYVRQQKRQQGREYHDERPTIPTGTEPSFIARPLIINPSSEQLSATKTNPTSNVSSVGMSPSEHQATLQHHADELAELERERERQQEMLTYSFRASPSSLAPAQTFVPTQSTQDQISDLNARIEILTRLMKEHMSPPAYDQDGGSQV
ncbi:hypothetical protein GYMLUDRAFT_55376 [Collybiopsis luxurians FD-317 M1]|nr:hypothetical protein GYMLUDRAFT_55376 [Collybiopsis luxurians FD-317 M1]